MKRLTLAQMRIIFILGAILLIVLTYFLVYQRNMEQVEEFDRKTKEQNERITYLTNLQAEVTDLDIFTSRYKDNIDPYIKSFPVKLTQQQSIYMIYRLMIDSGIDIQSITPGNQVPFYYKGTVLTSSGDQDQAQTAYEQEEQLSEITPVELEEMVGYIATYSINLSGKTKEIYEALDWIQDSDERMSVGNVNLQFDRSTGRLAGSIGINFYSMLGNGVAYNDPKLDFTDGVDNVFGEFK